MNFNFGEVLARAWQIIWKFKVLWIFGILASCSRGGGGGNGGGSGNYGGGGGNPSQFNYQMEEFGRWIQDNLWIVLALVAVIILLSLLFAALGFIGRIALIKGALKAERGAESMTFGELWAESLPYFWRVFGLSFLIGLAFLIILLPFVLIGIFTAGVGFLCLIPLLCLLAPAAIIVNVVVEQANIAIALEDLSMWNGFKRGWETVKANPAAIFVMTLILGAGSFVLGLVIAVPLILAALPLIFAAASEVTALLWVGVACIVIYLPVLIFLGGVLTAYIQTAWTLTYMRLTAPKPDEPILVEANA